MGLTYFTVHAKGLQGSGPHRIHLMHDHTNTLLNLVLLEFVRPGIQQRVVSTIPCITRSVVEFSDPEKWSCIFS